MSTDEFRIELIKLRLEDTLRELGDARESPIWEKLDFVGPWAALIMDLIRTLMENNTDKHVIANLAETNVYLTRKIIELECKPSEPRSETPQPHRTTNNNRPTQTPAQMSWAQVAAKAHQKMPTQPAKPPTKETPMHNQERTADPCCLIIQVSPPIPAMERPNGIEVRNQINQMLEEKGMPQYFRIMAVGYSMAGNIKIMTMQSCKVMDIITHGEEIAAIITANKVISILPDEDHYRVKINKIPTWYNSENPMMISNVHQELTTFVPEYDSMKKW